MDHKKNSDDTKKDDTKKIDGIRCEVSNCVYHDTSDCCGAGEIQVGPQAASTSSDTTCTTFQQQQNI